MTIWLAALAGIALGFVLSRGDFCFHSTWRRLVLAPRDTALLHAYVVLLLVATPIVQVLIAADVIEPWIPRLAWPAAILGGVLFGAGMVVAQTCVSGMFYKLGRGMLGMVVALGAWFIGDVITYRGPLSDIRDALNSEPVTVSTADGTTDAVTLLDVQFGVLLLAVSAIAGLVLVWRAKPASAQLGVATAAVIVVTWLLVDQHGGNYPFGTSFAPTMVWDRVRGGAPQDMWIPLALVAIIPGAYLAARTDNTVWVRGEDGRRYLQLAVGGLMMGVGAAIAGGCNLGHSMVGVPLLSAGSIVTTLAIIAGVFLTAMLVGARPNSAPADPAPPSVPQSNAPSPAPADSSDPH